MWVDRTVLAHAGATRAPKRPRTRGGLRPPGLTIMEGCRALRPLAGQANGDKKDLQPCHRKRCGGSAGSPLQNSLTSHRSSDRKALAAPERGIRPRSGE